MLTKSSTISDNLKMVFACLALAFVLIPVSVQLAGADAPADNTTISTNILSQTDSFSLSATKVLAASKTLASADGRVSLVFQAGTTMNLAGQTILGCGSETNPPSAADKSLPLRAYSFSPSGATFSPAVTMTLQYDPVSLPSGAKESALYIAFYNESTSAWETLPSTVNTTAHQITALTTHFTRFAIRYMPPITTPAATDNSTAQTTTTVTDNSTTTAAATTGQPASVSTNLLGSVGAFNLSGGIATSGASLSSSTGKLSFILSSNTTVNLQGSPQLSIIQLTSPPAPPSNARVIEAYSCGPENATFSPSANLTIKYDPTTFPPDVQEQGLYIALLQNASWSPLTTTVNTQAKTISAQVSHFSTYGVLGTITAAPVQAPVTQPSPPPQPVVAFSFSDLTANPQSPGVGQPITISVRVVNGGSKEATDNVVLKIDDKNEAQKQVTLASGKSQLVSFDIKQSTAGTYTASVGAQTVKFEVKAVAASAPSGFSLPVLIVIGLGGLLVIVLVLRLVIRQRQSD